jgi:hypothetical protein
MRPPARLGQGPLAMTAFDGGPLRRNQLQDKFGLPASKGPLGTSGGRPDPGLSEQRTDLRRADPLDATSQEPRYRDLVR